MDHATAQYISDVGIAVNVAAGHAAEMGGRAVEAAAQTVGCPVGATAGQAMQAAGRAWTETAIHVAHRDAGRIGQ